MSEVKTYNVYSRRGDWMGGYSTDLEKVNPSINCLEMAKQNAIQCKGEVMRFSKMDQKKKYTQKNENKIIPSYITTAFGARNLELP